MAITYKILGQSAPAVTTSTDLYTVPSATQTIVSTITVCNRDAASGTYRLSISPDGAAVANSQYLAYDVSVDGNQTVALTLGITIDASDKIRVYASTGNFTFNAFGSEIT